MKLSLFNVVSTIFVEGLPRNIAAKYSEIRSAISEDNIWTIGTSETGSGPWSSDVPQYKDGL